MSYWSHFTPDTVLESLACSDIQTTLDELVAALVTAKLLTAANAKKVKALLSQKIEQGATGAIGHGVAVPHVKLPGLKSTIAAFGRVAGGVDFRAGDGLPVTLCFFVVGPEEAPQEHLDFLRWIAGLARDPDFPRFALRCKSRKELIDLLKEVGGA